MTGKLQRIGAGVALVVLFAAGTLKAGAAKDQGEEREVPARQKVIESKRKLGSIFLEKRVEGIEELSAENDQALVNEFQIVRLISERAKSSRARARERVASLQGLTVLLRNGFGDQGILEILAAIVEEKTEPQVRVAALGLLGEMGGEGPLAMQAFGVMRKLWDKRKSRTRLPNRILAQVIEAIGGFYEIEASRKLLLEALRTESKSAAIRSSALRGLQMYLENKGEVEKDVIKSVTTILNGKNTGKEERIEAIRTLEILVLNGAPTTALGTTKKLLLGLLNTGDDVEVQAAVQLLMRMPDTEVLSKVLVAAWPDPKREPSLSFESYHMLSQALGESLNVLRGSGNRSPTDAQKTMATKISKHFVRVLDPNMKPRPAPKVLRKSAVFALGSWPIEFDRQVIVQVLIRLLELEKDSEIISETEEALQLLLQHEPFRTIDPDTKQEIPDVPAWKMEYDQAKEYLVAPKSPLERPEE